MWKGEWRQVTVETLAKAASQEFTDVMRLMLYSNVKPLEEGMATHSNALAWRIPWTEEPGGLQPRGSQSRTRASVWTHVCGVSPPGSCVQCASWPWVFRAVAALCLGEPVFGSILFAVSSLCGLWKLMSFAKYFSSPVFMTLLLGTPVTQMFDLQV